MLAFVFVFLLTGVIGQLTQDQTKMLNWCLDSNFHRKEPGPESELFEQCSPWKNRSCCTYDTTFKIHNFSHHNFNFDHCGEERKLSERCKRHFIQDFCFYECSPNIGPWVVKTEMKSRKERFYQVPFCKSDCDAWFDSCRNDYTCTDNWIRNFKWDKSGNRCRPEHQCYTFQEVFHNSSYFCETVWDGSWQVVNDTEPCMRLWFDGNYGNPNDQVALLKTKQLLDKNGSNNIVESVVILLFSIMLSTL